MRLLLDIGNTRMKWAVIESGQLGRRGGGMHRGPGVAAALAGLMAMEIHPAEIRVANVAGPAVAAAVAGQLSARWPVPQRWARAAPHAGSLRNGYRNPGQLGIDRWLGLCAAWPGPGHSLCLVAAGSALTIDLVVADGQHRGGLILPGLAMMVAALKEGTGDLARLAASGAPQADCREGWLAEDTGTAMAAGVLRAAVSVVTDCWHQLQREGPVPSLVLTGGDGARLAAALASAGVEAPRFRPDLVLEGLAMTPVCFAEAA